MLHFRVRDEAGACIECGSIQGHMVECLAGHRIAKVIALSQRREDKKTTMGKIINFSKPLRTTSAGRNSGQTVAQNVVKFISKRVPTF